MEKLDFTNEFIEKRERQIKRMVEKIDNVLRKYAKLYNILVKVKDWTFLMDIIVLTLTFQSEMAERFLLEDNKVEEDNKRTKKKTKTEYNEEIEEENALKDLALDSKIALLLGGDKYVSESIQQ